MTDEPHNLIIDHLRQLRAGQDRIENDMRDMKFRIGQIEQALAHHTTTLAHHSTRFDRIEDRLQKIENRLGLVDA